MLHAGVFVGRQYAAFAGITHGQRVQDFIEELVARKLVTPIGLGSTGRTRIFHVHHKPLYGVIGEPDNRNRRRVTIDRAIQRLMAERENRSPRRSSRCSSGGPPEGRT
jgi:hypothetical protein